MNWAWFMGFIEGEACFHISVRDYDRTDKRGNWKYIQRVSTAKFSISQKERAILDKIQSFLLEYGIRTGIHQNRKTRVFALATASRHHCATLASLLEDQEWFTQSKFTSFTRWKQALEMMEQKRHLTNREEFRAFCKTINKHSPKTF